AACARDHSPVRGDTGRARRRVGARQRGGPGSRARRARRPVDRVAAAQASGDDALCEGAAERLARARGAYDDGARARLACDVDAGRGGARRGTCVPREAQMSVVEVERDGAIAVVLLNRPDALNALSGEVMDALVSALEELDGDASIRCIVVGGSERVFAAGADVGELAAATPIELYENRRIDRWDAIRALRTPLGAAVSGYCLGGGCELAMTCDVIVASETAQFGQPEINPASSPGPAGRSA